MSRTPVSNTILLTPTDACLSMSPTQLFSLLQDPLTSKLWDAMVSCAAWKTARNGSFELSIPNLQRDRLFQIPVRRSYRVVEADILQTMFVPRRAR